jgi:hypothetical protein
MVALRTPVQAAAANPECEGIVVQLKAEARRMGYDLKDNEIVDTVALDRAFKGHDINRRLAWKVAAAQIGILA